MKDLTSASREELFEVIASLLARVEELEARVGQLQEEVRRLRQGKGGGTP